ncbi:MAG: hypothetical protein V1900_01510 [Candidatus Aenigmatarchaeota archaeon]
MVMTPVKNDVDDFLDSLSDDPKSSGFAALSTFRDVAARDIFKTIADDITSHFIPNEFAYILCNRKKGDNMKTDRYVGEVDGYFELCGIDTGIVRISAKDAQISERFSDDEYYEYAFERLASMGYSRELPKWLIGWMKIVPDAIVNRYLMINLHPSGPDGPKGKWEDVVWQSIEEHRKHVEAMIHIATPEMDRGPVLVRYDYPTSKRCNKLYEKLERRLDNGESFKEIKENEYRTNLLFKRFRMEQQRLKENALIAVAMSMLGSGELRIDGRNIYHNERLLTKEGLLVNDRVDGYMQGKGVSLPY